MEASCPFQTAILTWQALWHLLPVSSLYSRLYYFGDGAEKAAKTTSSVRNGWKADVNDSSFLL